MTKRLKLKSKLIFFTIGAILLLNYKLKKKKKEIIAKGRRNSKYSTSTMNDSFTANQSLNCLERRTHVQDERIDRKVTAVSTIQKFNSTNSCCTSER